MANVFTLTDGDDTFRPSGDDLLDSAVISALPGNDNVQGTDFADEILGNEDDDVLLGRFGADIIYGGQGNDSLDGDEDDDQLLGNIGIDTIEGGPGNDIIWGGPDGDVISGQSGADQVLGNLGDDTMTGGDGDDIVWGGKGNDSLLGQDGNDVVLGNIGNDYIETGDGNDIAYGGQDADTIIGGLGDDELLGNIGSDIIDGEQGADTLFGGQGNDTLTGGLGADSILGGVENDFIVINSTDEVEGDFYDGGDGTDTLWVTGNADVSEVEFTGIENYTIVTTGVTLGVTQAQADSASVYNLAEDATAGTIQLTDVTVNDLTNQEIESILDKASAGITVVDSEGDVLGVGGNAITGTDEADTITPGELSNGVTGNAPSDDQDLIDGLGGNDTIDAAGGRDTIQGGSGNDVITGGDGNDSLQGNGDNDTLTGGLGADTIIAGMGDDFMVIDSADEVAGDSYDGGDGNDVLLANASADVSALNITGIETFTVAETETLTISLGQGEEVSSLTGSGAFVQVNASTQAIEDAGILAKAGPGLTILDEAGTPVV